MRVNVFWIVLSTLRTLLADSDFLVLRFPVFKWCTEVDMLENVQIGEQKRRDEAYKASKKKTGVYDDQ